MTRCKTVLVNLLLLLGATSCLGWAGRPEFAPAEGCKPGQRTTLECPKVSRDNPLSALCSDPTCRQTVRSHLEGFGVLSRCTIRELRRVKLAHTEASPNEERHPQELGGRCDCDPLWFKLPAPLPFDPDAEFTDGTGRKDCVNHTLGVLFHGLGFLGCAISMTAFLYTCVAVIREMIRVKALRFNATAYALITMAYASLGILGVDLVYVINQFGGDRDTYLYYYRTILFSWFCIPCMTIIDFEICVTWIDLYDRTNKMSKSSSKMTKALRILCRIISLFLTFGFQYVGIASGTILGLFIAAMLPNVCGIVALSIGSPLILKTLCPDKKDVSNPNWKIAEAIRRAVKHGIGSKLIELIALTGMAFTSRSPTIGYTYGVWNFLYWFATMFRMWGWLQYVIYGSRKHLKKYSAAKSSSYFGFSTIGLNKTLTTASSRASSVISGISTRSSVAE